ncbi:MAG TPA: carbonic anhydrase [Thiobacillaceae bacterium]|nr:carbonic anhydrase [Thiobacillaceae bacterium]
MFRIAALTLTLSFTLLHTATCHAANPMPPATDGDKERIRAIVKEVLREYAAVMSNKQAGGTEAKDMLGNLVQDNATFMRTHRASHFKPFMDGQHPRATVVTCADSRVHTHALDTTPDGDLFMIRNIGNQLATAEGSVEYGVHHLHTPLLLFMGHSACGAIKAAAGDYAAESPAIRRELDTIQIPKGEPGLSSIRLNVNNQVRDAMAKFESEVMTGRLTVVGAIYDFRNDMRQGQGRLNIINVNGETDPAAIARLELMQDLEKPAPKGKAKAAPAAHH